EYNPEDIETVEVTEGGSGGLQKDESFKVMSWNIGYGALGDNADFFMDGGTGVMTADEQRLDENLSEISSQIKNEDPDLLLLQEIDLDSKRSHNVDELDYMKGELGNYSSAFAYNYKVKYVPYPVPTLGKVESGIATLSKAQIDRADRYQLPVPFSWPVRTANLKRGLLLSHIPVDGSDKELVLINLHLEAYDSGEGKVAQTKMLSKVLKEERDKGNYVIAGGDFNQIFSSEDETIYPTNPELWTPGEIDVDHFDKGFQFIMDESTPTCRSLDRPYEGADPENFQYYLIDGFIVSDNITIEKAETLDLGFKATDHNPVVMELTL
ncbi:MAG: endonuclease/exonuclease/phosphatase family protein, partial [Bacillota bacterium]